MFFFLEVPLLVFFALNTDKEVWPDGTHPMLFVESSCICVPSFTTVASLFFSVKSSIFVVFFK